MKIFSWRNAALALVLTTTTAQALAGGRGHWRDRGHYHRGSSSSVWIGGAALLGAGALLAWSASRPSYGTSVYVGSGSYYGPGYGYGRYYGPAITYSAPVYAAPVYVAPPIYPAPVYVTPPVYSSPGYASPGYSSSGYVAPGDVTPTSVAPAYGPPSAVYDASPNEVGVSNGSVTGTRYMANADVIAYPAKGQDAGQQARDHEACRSWAMNQSGFDPTYVSTYTTRASTDSYQRALGACYKGRGYTIN